MDMWQSYRVSSAAFVMVPVARPPQLCQPDTSVLVRRVRC